LGEEEDEEDMSSFLVPDDVEDALSSSSSSGNGSGTESEEDEGNVTVSDSCGSSGELSEDDDCPVVATVARRRQGRVIVPAATGALSGADDPDFEFRYSPCNEVEEGAPRAAVRPAATPSRTAVPSAAPPRPSGHPTPAKGVRAAAAPLPKLRDGDIDPLTGLVCIAEEVALGHSSSASGGEAAAHRFRTVKQRDALTAALLKEYNARVFGDRLPVVPVQWNKRLTRTAGLTYTSRERCHAGATAGGSAVDGGIGGESRLVARLELSTKVVDSPLKLAQVGGLDAARAHP